MRIYVAGNKRIAKYILPSKLEEFFSVEYQPENSHEKFTITFRGDINSNKWYLKSNGDVDIYSKDNTIEELPLEYYQIYFVKLFGLKGYITIYAMPEQDNITSLDYQNIEKITIGSKDCNINYNNSLINDLVATISKNGNDYILLVGDNLKIPVFINDKKVKEKKLKYGDIIFINGLKIIWLPKYIKINNPNNQVTNSGLNPIEELRNDNNTIAVTDEEASQNLYDEEEYFYHTPKLQKEIIPYNITIDNPPLSQLGEDTPVILKMGSSLTLLISAGAMIYNIFDKLNSGLEVADLLAEIITAASMLMGSIIMPSVLSLYTKSNQKKKEKKRLIKYREYLKKKTEEIEEEIKVQETILLDNNDITIKCADNVNKNLKNNIWNREIEDNDFLNISLGMGETDALINIKAPEEHFELETDVLYREVFDVINSHKKLHNIPITFSFIENNISSFVFNCTYREDYINSIILKMATLHSGNDLKFVILTDENNEGYWQYIKELPHIWSDDKSLRFFATSSEEASDISTYLDEEFEMREANENEDITYKNFSPYYVIITDNYLSYKNSSIILDIIRSKKNYGFSLITLADSMKQLPNRCENFIQIGESSGCILSKLVTEQNQVKFINDYVKNLDMENLCTKLSNIPLISNDELKELPDALTFLEMFKTSKIEELNVLNRWQRNNPTISLATTIGVHSDLEPFKIDLHEKYDGPHGIIAGSTGSGKTEFIITYILSMALNYNPYEVQFLLIDYNDVGLVGAFENKDTTYKLPHIVGTITDLDNNKIKRIITAIDSEFKRRQILFDEAKKNLGESVIDIYKYQSLYREGRVKEPISHLFIISDEFAELNSEYPGFLKKLLSLASIGRTFGIHLILATQNPSGLVNDQMLANSKLKVCLKVQSQKDSIELLKKPDAANIKNAGRFYLQVGYDDYFAIGQSGFCGAKYIPSSKRIKKIDDSISFINNIGQVIKVVDDNVDVDSTSNVGSQLVNIIKYISEMANKENIKVKDLWLDELEPNIYVENLKKKYNYRPQSYNFTPVIGEYDDPESGEQGLLTLNLNDNGNTVLYGSPGSGKGKLFTTTLWSLMLEHTPEEVNIYAIDYGTDMLDEFDSMPHVGGVVDSIDEERVAAIIKMAQDELTRRKKLLKDYGSYEEYIKKGNQLSLMVIAISNYDAFMENYPKLYEIVEFLFHDCGRYGIVFILSTVSTTAIKKRMHESFGNILTMQLEDRDNYREILNCDTDLIPSKNVGRGLVRKNKKCYEFQTASICPYEQLVPFINMVSTKLNEIYKTHAKKVEVNNEK